MYCRLQSVRLGGLRSIGHIHFLEYREYSRSMVKYILRYVSGILGSRKKCNGGTDVVGEPRSQAHPFGMERGRVTQRVRRLQFAVE